MCCVVYFVYIMLLPRNSEDIRSEQIFKFSNRKLIPFHSIDDRGSAACPFSSKFIIRSGTNFSP